MPKQRPRQPGQRGPQRFAAITYPLLSTWTGLTIQTIRTYAQKGHFDPHDLAGTLVWVNTRRAQQGLRPIGQPESPRPDQPQQPPIPGIPGATDAPPSGGYNPQTGEFNA